MLFFFLGGGVVGTDPTKINRSEFRVNMAQHFSLLTLTYPTENRNWIPNPGPIKAFRYTTQQFYNSFIFRMILNDSSDWSEGEINVRPDMIKQFWTPDIIIHDLIR